MRHQRLLVAAAVAWLSAAVLIGGSWLVAAGYAVFCLVLALGALLAGTRRRPHRASAWVALAAAAASLVSCSVAVRAHERQTGPLLRAGKDRAVAVVRGVVASDPRVLPGRVVGVQRSAEVVLLRLEVRRVTVAGVTSRVRGTIEVRATEESWKRLLPSEELEAEGRFGANLSHEPAAAGFVARGAPLILKRPQLVQRWAQRLRSGLQAASSDLAKRPGGLLPGLVDGDVSQLDSQVHDEFRKTSLTHLTAVSGSNVSIVLATVLGIAGLGGASPRARAVLAALGLAMFVVIARPSPSVLRAAAMGAVLVLALLAGRPRRCLPALGAAVLALLAYDPDLARSVGFALSTFATAGIVVLAPIIETRLPQSWPLLIRRALAVPFAAQLACAPIIGAAFGTVGLSSVPANLLASPVVAPATICGVLAAVLALVWMPLARVMADLGGYCCGWLVDVAHAFARVPGSSVSIPTGWIGAAVALLVAFTMVVAFLHHASRRAIAAGLLGCALAGVVLTPLVTESWPPRGWAFVACDVGQGDALVVRGGEAGDVLIDSGPDPRKVRACLSRLRVRRLQRIILTHLHADHVEGLAGILGSLPVAGIEVGPLKEPPDEWARVQRWAAQSGVSITEAVAGERGSAGSAQWEVLGPTSVLHGTDSDPNNASLVLALRAAGVSALLTGDAENVAQSALLSRVGDVVQADVLKVPHHGSAKQDGAFLDRVRSRITVTSVGAGNPYGHPSAMTLNRLARDGAAVLRTDLDGAIAVLRRGESVIAVATKHRNQPGSAPPLPPGAAAMNTPRLAGIGFQPKDLWWCT